MFLEEGGQLLGFADSLGVFGNLLKQRETILFGGQFLMENCDVILHHLVA